MDDYKWPESVKASIKKYTEDVETCRAMLGYIDGPNRTDVSWRAQWPLSADAFLLAIESLVYGFSRGSTLKKILKNRKTTEEFLKDKEV